MEQRSLNLQRKQRKRVFDKCLRKRLRYRIRNAFMRQRVPMPPGCFRLCGDIEQVGEWLQRTFQPGMSWDRRAKDWTIDHRIPISAFDLSDTDQQRRAFHYTNMQAMWPADNFAKGCNVDSA